MAAVTARKFKTANPFLAALIGIIVLIGGGCAAGSKPSPAALTDQPDSKTAPFDILSSFEGIPYRPDGAINRSGEYTFFSDQQARPVSPGLNCSGFLVAYSRYLFGRNYSLNEVRADRLTDSGPYSAMGKDWDFGYDLILNLTEGMPRKVMLPFGGTADIEGSNGAELRGFELHDFKAWADVTARMTPGHAYLFSMSKPVRFRNYQLLHHHVGVIVPDHAGHLWLSQATTGAGVSTADIAAADRLQSILAANPDSSLGKRMILIIEAPLQQASSST